MFWCFGAFRYFYEPVKSDQFDAIHITAHRPFFQYWQCYLCMIVCYSSVKNSSRAYKAHIFILLKLCYICWGSPDEHFAVCPKSAGRKTMEIHGVEVDQSSSTIFGHMMAGNVRFFFNDIISIFILINAKLIYFL